MTRSTPNPDSGLYIVWMRLPSVAEIRVGALGTFTFAPGLYAYVGSAQRNRRARVARHLRTGKIHRWHIDYFREAARVIAVTLCDGDRSGECRLVQQLVDAYGAEWACSRFGASDCRCPGHLLRVAQDTLDSVASEGGWP